MQARLLLLVTLLTATAASAQPRPRPTFSATTSFESCSKSWAFACGKRDSGGQTYGTAHEMTHCERYVFQPDGTFSSSFERGTYTIVNTTVTIVTRNDDGSEHKVELSLSADGATLGSMKRLTR
ncbi:MAG: hypothetical protein H0T42_32965 [Deltaproteobacteria bacterium]|nr:hypothetical protein [Deltaproteobacteria bacterium]